MDNIQRRLDLKRGGKQTQKMQRDVLVRLDEMIKELENKKRGEGENEGHCPDGGNGVIISLYDQKGGPQVDTRGGSASGTGQSGRQRVKEIAEVWGKLSEKDRRLALARLTRGLPARDRAVIESYFKPLSRRMRGAGGSGKGEEPARDLVEMTRSLAAKLTNNDRLLSRPLEHLSSGRAGNARSSGGTRRTPPPPQVWKRDGSSPTFARVYVGDKNSLKLVSLHVTVHIEGARARTLVDHVFHNPHPRALEGTFEYPLPAGASPAYYAMFLGASRDRPPPRFRPAKGPARALSLEQMTPTQVARRIDSSDWGKLQEARLVAPERAAEVYEEITRRQIDPALLEYASGNTFRGRVFPIQPKGYNRVLIAYEETLPVVGERLVYRFALPGRKVEELSFVLGASARECREATFLPKDAKKSVSKSRLSFRRLWSKAKPKGEIVFSARPAQPTVQSSSGRLGAKGPLYLHARLRPTLPKAKREEPVASQAVFLLDTSLSEHPERFGVSMKLLEAILKADSDIKQFNILAFNAGTAWVEPKGWLANTKAGRKKALARLEGIVLEGATDLSAALERVCKPGWKMGQAPTACFLLSDGHLTWGQTDAATVAARFRKNCPFPVRFFCYRTGLGEENTELYEALTRDNGAIFQCFADTEVRSAASAHRRQCLLIEKVRFDGGPQAREVLVAGRRAAVYPGGELVVVGHFLKAGKMKIVVEGRFNGARFKQSFPVEVSEVGELAPRAWGEVAVAQLLALNDPSVEALATGYCQQFGIASRVASFLVLESESDYKQYQIDKERKATLEDSDLDRYLNDTWKALASQSSQLQAFRRLLQRIDSRTKVLEVGQSDLSRLLALLKEDDCVLPAAPLAVALLKRTKTDKAYLAAIDQDSRDVRVYLKESSRRFKNSDKAGAVQALSSVVEMHPGRGDALRLVGYRLLELKQPAQAAQLFARVLRQRPFEPHSYRDLARALEEAGRYPLAALLNETVLAGTWDGRFGEAVKVVTREEQSRLMRLGLRKGKLNAAQQAYFQKRLKALAGEEGKDDLRVTITWNTDNTDVDLCVSEPGGFLVTYRTPKSRSGGELSQDLTQGYGPERYRAKKATKGEYWIVVHYFAANPNLLAGETHVSVTVTRHAGTDREKVERHTVILRKQGEQKTVCRVRLP